MSQVRFGIRGVMMTTMVVAMTMAAGSQFYLASQSKDRKHMLFGMLILVTGPILMLGVASLIWRRPRRRQ